MNEIYRYQAEEGGINFLSNYDAFLYISHNTLIISILEPNTAMIKTMSFVGLSTEDIANNTEELSAFIMEILGKYYIRQVYVLLNNPLHMLVPMALEADIEAHFAFNFGEKHTHIQVQHIDGTDIKSVFAVDDTISTFVNNWAINPKYYHISGALVQLSLPSMAAFGQKSGQNILVQLQGSVLNIIVFENGAIQLTNTFITENFDDACYRILSVYEATHLAASLAKLYIFSTSEFAAEIAEAMGHYFSEIKPMDISIPIKNADELVHNFPKALLSLLPSICA